MTQSEFRMTSDDVDQHLDNVSGLLKEYKNDSIKEAIISICHTAQRGDFWPDEVNINLPKKDRNCMGIAYRILACNLRAIEKKIPLECRRSQHGPSCGRVIFRYKTTDIIKVKQLLK